MIKAIAWIGGILDKHGKIAVIPARGGSKRLKKKNIRPFMGKPMILYSVEAALETGLFDRVVVSTEDREIADCVSQSRCDIHHRNDTLATDSARVTDVLMKVLEDYSEQGLTFRHLCCLYATAPLRTSQDITESFGLMQEKGADFCQSVTDFETSPFFAFDMDKGKRIKRRWPEFAVLPPAEKPLVVVDNGSIYWAKVDAFKKNGELDGDNTVGHWMERWRSVDIDTLTDFRLAEFYFRELKHG